MWCLTMWCQTMQSLAMGTLPMRRHASPRMCVHAGWT